MFRTMLQDGKDLDMVTHGIVISGFEKGSQWARALSVIEELGRRSLTADEISHNAAASACAKARRWHLTLGILERLRLAGGLVDVVSFNAAISACEKALEWRRSLALLGEVRRRRLEPQTASYSAAVSACERLGHAAQAAALLAELRRSGLRVDAVAGNAAASACGEWRRAVALLGGMRREGLDLELASYGAAVAVCGASRQWRWAARGLAELEAGGRAPNAAVGNAVLSACHGARRWARSLGLLGGAGGPRGWWDVTSYATGVASCELGLRAESAAGLLPRAQREGLLALRGGSRRERRAAWRDPDPCSACVSAKVARDASLSCTLHVWQQQGT